MRPILARLTSVALSAALLPALVLTAAAHAHTGSTSAALQETVVSVSAAFTSVR